MPGLEQFSLEGKVAIVTGASSGLGVSMAESLAMAGADVAIAARRVDRLQETAKLVEATGRRVAVVEADVSKQEDCARAVQETVDQLGRLDILVNNAGLGLTGPALRQPPEDFRAVIATNLEGAFWLSCRAAEAMTDGGSIINISSISAVIHYGLPQTAYASSKAAMIAMTSELAHEWTSRRGIRVNAILPGFFITEMTAGLQEGAEWLHSRTATKRVGEPHELTGAVIYLASDASSYMTGQTMIIDGGFTTG